ncbi:ankyrin repeat-containing domain protein [Baffinella frigidus]|nr:ankyrin repeat-containing domain protein [Cryptophyta sp. CCMP2293]
MRALMLVVALLAVGSPVSGVAPMGLLRLVRPAGIRMSLRGGAPHVIGQDAPAAGEEEEVKEEGDAEMGEEAEEDDDEEEIWKHKTSPLLFAAAGGDLDEVKRLIAEGADVNAPTRKKGEAPLHVAVKRGHLEVVKALLQADAVLLEAGADVNMQRRNMDTPLLIAAHRSKVDVLNELLDNGADLAITGRGLCSSALHIAVENEDEGIAKAILTGMGAEELQALRERRAPGTSLVYLCFTRNLLEKKNVIGHTSLELA